MSWSVTRRRLGGITFKRLLKLILKTASEKETLSLYPLVFLTFPGLLAWQQGIIGHLGAVGSLIALRVLNSSFVEAKISCEHTT